MENPIDKLHTALKIQHNLLGQRANAILAMAELIQDYRALSSQLINQMEKLKNEHDCLAAKPATDSKTPIPNDIPIPGTPSRASPGQGNRVPTSASSPGDSPVDSSKMDGSTSAMP